MERAELIDRDFIASFKQSTEGLWSALVINPGLYGFQFQKGTRWNPGLSEIQIDQYEKELGFGLSSDLRLFLRYLNGTDLPTVNVYGNCGEPHRTSEGIYSYPRDLEHVKNRMEDLVKDWRDVNYVLAEVGFEDRSGSLFPFYSHRYVACGRDFPNSPVLSVHGSDAIVYAPNFREYLKMEFLRDG